MTSLTLTFTRHPDDTPATYALTPGQHVFARDIGAHEADALAELLEDGVWRVQRRQVGAAQPQRQGAR